MAYDIAAGFFLSREELQQIITDAVGKALTEHSKRNVDEDEQIGIDAAAEYLGISRHTIYDWMKKDIMPMPEFTRGKRKYWLMSTIKKMKTNSSLHL